MSHTSTNAAGRFVLAYLIGFVIVVALMNGLIDRLAWAVGGGW